MKIADGAFSQETFKKSSEKHLIPLEPPDDAPVELTTTNNATFLLHPLPTDSDSPKHKFTIKKTEGNKGCCPLIVRCLAVQKIFTGLNVQALAMVIPIVKATLSGTTLILVASSVADQLTTRMELQARIAAEGDAGQKALICTNGCNHTDNHEWAMFRVGR